MKKKKKNPGERVSIDIIQKVNKSKCFSEKSMKEKERESGREGDRQTGRERQRQTDRQADRRTGRQTSKQTDRNTDRQTESVYGERPKLTQ